MRRISSLIVPLGLLVASACSPPPVQSDAPQGDATDTASDTRSDTIVDVSATCTTDNDCTDSLFCNGAERCMPGASGANLRGCVPGTPACTGGATCNETTQRCATNCADADGDGHGARSCGGDDCDDTDAMRFPGNPEVCDSANHDEDCESATFGLRDNDGDGYFDHACCNVEGAGGAMHCGADCDDGHANVHPGATESCDGLDNDCSGTADDGITRTCWSDGDGDGFGNPTARMTSMGCTLPTGCVENGNDCDDSHASANPSAPEVCDRIDNNCNGVVDEAVSLSFYPDCDGDGFGDATGIATVACLPSDAMACNGNAPVLNHTDCDDVRGARNPAAPEICNSVDDNCDGMIDNGLPVYALYPDCDGDGFGASASMATRACSIGAVPACSGHPAVQSAGDCDDAVATLNPASPEVCNGVDDNCDGAVDNGLPSNTYYADCDGDGFGRTTMSVVACSRPSSAPSVCGTIAYAGWTLYGGDCDDTNFATYPGAAERCDGVDNNCDGTNGEDSDGDGHIVSTSSCARGAGFFLPVDDCRDDIAAVHPGVTQYFGTPACPPGTTPCMYTQVTPPSSSSLVIACLAAGAACPVGTSGNPGVCLSGGCPPSVANATFDYDCSGASDPQPSSTPACSSPTRTGLCLGSGVNYTSPPQCGYPVTTWSCPYSFAPSCAAPTSSSGPMPCR